MRDDRIDLRKETLEGKDSSISLSVSLAVSTLLIVAGLTMAFLPTITQGGEGPEKNATDSRPNILLASTIDRVEAGDKTLTDLPVSELLYMVMKGDISLDDGIRRTIIDRAEFLYEGSTLTITAFSPGLGDLTILDGDIGKVTEATIPVGEGTLTLSISVSGVE